MPSRRIICEKRAQSAIPLRPTNGCLKSSWSWFSAANSTRSGSPTRRSRSLKPLSSSERKRGFHGSRDRSHHAHLRSPDEPLRRRQRRGARQGDGLRHHVVRGRREGYASFDGVRADLFARNRRQHRSGEGGVYGAVEGLRTPLSYTRKQVSSTLRLLGSIANFSGILGRP